MAWFYSDNLKKLDSRDESAERPNTLYFHNMANSDFCDGNSSGLPLRPE